MSILIKGMEMPKSCYDCYFCRTYDEPNQGYFCIPLFADLHRTDFTKKRIDACPLISVPDHGRLIDADEFYADINESVLLADGFKEAFNLWFDEQPTIIPASGKEET